MHFVFLCRGAGLVHKVKNVPSHFQKSRNNTEDVTFIATALPAKKILLYEAGVAQAVHLPPVGFKGFLYLCLRVQQVLNKVVEGGAYV